MIFLGTKSKMELQNKFASIYDKLNEQPHLQEIIRNYYYDGILKDEAKDGKFHVLDTLNYAYGNVRQHQEEIYGRVEEKDFLRFIKHSVFYEVIGNNKFGKVIYGFKRIIEQYYGSDWQEYYNYEYLDYSDSEEMNGYDSY